MPNGSVQEALMYKAYSEAGLDPTTTSYVKAHGTGTEVGDAIKAGAIASVFSRNGERRKPVIVGSIKTNISHTKATAGIAGLIKTALILEKGKIVPNYDFRKPTWPIPELLRASVNSFGYGGTNTHVILDAAEQYQISHGVMPPYHGRKPSSGKQNSGIVLTNGDVPKQTINSLNIADTFPRNQKNQLLILSSNSKESLRIMIEALKTYATQRTENVEGFLDDLAYTVCCRRSLLPFRLARTASTVRELLDSLAHSSLNVELAKSSKALDYPNLCFILTGQGA
ncbi:MAG: hypothetical protein Q9223_007002 [Gallowayella weberi]